MDFKLDAYEGPLDLLLKLIRRHEIDIYDIPIAELTAQYLDEVANLPPDMGRLSEFLVMAATLLEIKSQMLLPRPKSKQEEEPEDPREILVQKLLAYKQAQALAAELGKRTPEGERLTGTGDGEILAQIKSDANTRAYEPDMVSLSHLSEIFAEVLSRKEERVDTVRTGFGELPRDRFTIEEKVAHVQHELRLYGRLSLRFLFQSCRSKNEMVVTFLALLEMVRQSEIRISQPEAFADVEVTPCL